VQGALLERKKIGGNFLQSIEREKKVQVTEKHNPPRIQVTLASSSNAGTLYCHKFEELTTPAIYHHCGLSSLDEVGDGRADCGDLDGVRAVPRDRQRGGAGPGHRSVARWRVSDTACATFPFPAA
jgi:hypothetical protein